MSSSKNEKIDFLNQDTSKDLYEIFLKKEKLIITTIQKLNNVLSSYKNEKIEFLTNKKFVFIIDECHRSNAGLMGKRIKDYLNNSIIIGFSGTPIFEENNDRETQKIFGNEIDSYNMKDAILDKNVLGFKVVNYYQETRIFRENNNSNLGKIKSIINVIKSKHLDFTNNRNYNSIIAFDTIQDALTFYDEFYKMDVGDIFATPIFSSYSNEEKNEEFFNLKEHKEKILKRYEEKFNTSFKVEDFDKYVNDVQWRFKEYNSENNSIDIVIVVDMLLTGFDSPRTNTLYINKELKNHNLIQAFSRTNRLSDYLKKRGIIVNFSLEEQSINDAFKIYANSSDKEIQQLVYGEKYEQVVEDFINFWNSLKISFSNIYDEKNNEIFRNISLENKKKYLKNLSQVSNIFSSLKTFKEYGKNEKISDFSLEQLNQYQKWANEIKKNLSTNEKEKISYEVLNSIDISNIKFAYKEMIIDEIYLENLLFFNKKISKYPNNRLTYEDTLSEIDKHIQLIKNNYNQGKINQKEYEIFLLLVQKWKNEIKNFFIKKDKSLDEKEFIDYGKRILKSVFQKVKNQIEAMWLEKILKEYHGINNDQIRKDWKKRINDKDLDDIEKSEFIKKWSRRSKEVDKDIIDKLSIEYKESIEAFLDFEIKMNKIIESKI
ncbi:Type-1 restriction enzyme R protein [Mycoplasmopsis pulmonis]|nr:Type-1 restriction enzyme R protein [Mycoplasmopsis pulmonis]